MHLNPETMVHDYMYDIRYRVPDTLNEPILFEFLRWIQVSCAMFKMTSFVNFRPYLKSFNSIEKYIRWLEDQMTDIARNLNYKFMEQNLSMVINRTLPLGVGVSPHIKVHPQVCTIFMQPHQEILYLNRDISGCAFEIPRCPRPSMNPSCSSRWHWDNYL